MKRLATVVSIRLPPREADQLSAEAERTGRTISGVARAAIAAFLRGGAADALPRGGIQASLSGPGTLLIGCPQ